MDNYTENVAPNVNVTSRLKKHYKRFLYSFELYQKKRSRGWRQIIIKFGQFEEVKAELYDTPTGRTFYDILPIEATLRTFGELIYFECKNLNVNLEEDAREVGM